jgi:hypothetical protein
MTFGGCILAKILANKEGEFKISAILRNIFYYDLCCFAYNKDF